MNDLALYLAIRYLIQTGDLLLWHSHELVGGAIQAIRRATVNHASVVCRLIGLSDIKIFNYESLSDGFNPHYLSKELSGYKGNVWWYALKDEYGTLNHRKAIEERLLKYEGTPYDYPTLLRMAWRHPDKDTDALICSEAADIVITGNEGGHVLAPDELPSLGIFKEGVRIL